MLYQGGGMHLLKLETIVEHGGDGVGTEEGSDGMVENGQESDSSESGDLVESEKEDDDNHESKKKVLQNEMPKDE
jgi:hypothetical protein